MRQTKFNVHEMCVVYLEDIDKLIVIPRGAAWIFGPEAFMGKL